jgi:hypothetical protein
MLERCGMQYFYRYIERIKSPPGVALLVGSATHVSVEENLNNRLHLGEMLPVEACMEIGRDELNKKWDAEEPMLTPDEKASGAKKVRGEAVDRTVRLSRLHRTDLAPAIRPVAIEKPFRIEIPENERDIIGYIDILEPGRIRDTKTRSRSPNEADVHKNDQLTVYALAHWVGNKTAGEAKVPSVHLDCLVSTKEPKVVSIASTRSAEDFARLLERVQRVTAHIKAGNFIPAPRDSWICDPKWCGYWDRCPFGAANRSTKSR